MKRAIYLWLFSLLGLAGMAQTVELMRLYTDKDCYLAGEELWIKVHVDDEVLPGNAMSRVAYVEIGDTSQIRAQGKIALQDGTGWACIRLPQTMHSGMYQLVAYTQYMRNLNPESFPRKYLAVVNARMSSGQDHWVANDSTGFIPAAPEKEQKSRLLVADKARYGLREKVLLKWSSYLAEAKELTLSVVRKDFDAVLPLPEIALPEAVEGKRWSAECEGHIVTGRVVGDSLPKGILTQLSCVGKDMHVFEGKKTPEGNFRFYTHGVDGQQDVVLAALTPEGQAFRMELETPFAEVLPKQVPTLHCHFRPAEMLDRSVALQLSQATPKLPLPRRYDFMVYGQLPTKTYNLDEYVRFNTVKECIIEFVLGAAIDKLGERTIIKMLQDDSKEYSQFPVLVLVDGVAFHDHSEVLAYNARQVHYIHLYRGYYALGETVYGGILSLVTHRGTMPDMRINDKMQMMAYEFPQQRPAFVLPDYSEEAVKSSRRPDFRHTLYWDPAVEGKTEAAFYTSDMEGTYVAVLRGIDSLGKEIQVKCEFVVQSGIVSPE